MYISLHLNDIESKIFSVGRLWFKLGDSASPSSKFKDVPKQTWLVGSFRCPSLRYANPNLRWNWIHHQEHAQF